MMLQRNLKSFGAECVKRQFYRRCQMKDVIISWLSIKKMVSKLLIKLHKREDAPCISLRRLTFSFSPLRRALISSSSCCWSINEKTTGVTQAKAHTVFMTLPVHCRFVQEMCVVFTTFVNHFSCLQLGKFDEYTSKANLHFLQKRQLFHVLKINPFQTHVSLQPYTIFKHLKGNSPVSDISFFIALSASLFLFLLESRSTI